MDTLSDLVNLNYWEFSKYHLCPSKIDMAYVYILFFKDKSIQNGPKVIMVLSDTLSNLDKHNYGEYSKYQLCSSKIDMTYVYMLFFKDKSILNGLSMIKGDQDALGHPQRPCQAQPWRVH